MGPSGGKKTQGEFQNREKIIKAIMQFMQILLTLLEFRI